MIQTAADISGASLEVEITSDKKKSLIERLPYLETSDGTVLFDVAAIVQHISRSNPGSGLLGSTTFDQAKVTEWISWTQNNWSPAMHKAVLPVLGIGRPDAKKFAEGVK